jgi:DNA-binding SARP family transcriptional activator
VSRATANASTLIGIRTDLSVGLPGSAAGAQQEVIGTIDFRVLGPVEAQRDGQIVPLAGTRQLSVLAALSLDAGRVVTVGRLARAVWDGVPPPTGRAQIQGSIVRLRRCLPDMIRTVGQGYLLAAASEQVDAMVFRNLCRQAKAAARDRRPAAAAASFRLALGLWRGKALDGTAGLSADAVELEERRVAAVAGLFAAELGTGRHVQVVPDLYKQVTKLPCHEPLRSLLMLALYRCGREAEALMAYHDGCRVLAEHLGSGPGSGLRRLARAIQVRDPGLNTQSSMTWSKLH